MSGKSGTFTFLNIYVGYWMRPEIISLSLVQAKSIEVLFFQWPYRKSMPVGLFDAASKFRMRAFVRIIHRKGEREHVRNTYIWQAVALNTIPYSTRVLEREAESTITTAVIFHS